MKQINLATIPCFREAELPQRWNEMTAIVDDGNGPVLIQTEKRRDLLLFGWEDYFERYGFLYSNEELEQIASACRAHAE